MHVSFAIFADAANLSQEGKLNILGVFDAVQVGQTPTVHPRAHLVVHRHSFDLRTIRFSNYTDSEVFRQGIMHTH